MGSSRFVASNKLATDERSRLYGGLERFVNLSDGYEDYLKFAAQWPTFFPIRIVEKNKVIEWSPECHVLVLAYRDLLREVWAPSPNLPKQKSLAVLLGIDQRFLQFAASRKDAPLKDFPLANAFRQLRESHPNMSLAFASFGGLSPDWIAGQFLYTPQNDLQSAVYALFRESWRARICAHCAAYFIAGKPAQLYCSTTCSNRAKQKRSLEWWRREGAARRKRRQAKTRKKGDK